MAKIFLRSGSLDALLALGENGQPLWLSALQLRETLRLRQQPQIADCLAIPQPNDAGDRLDWYSPVSGKVTSWAAASNGARAAALTQLRACQQVMSQLSEQACASAKPSQRLFGALLSKALQFPDEFHVYLVDGKPVITFWGFVSLEKRAHKDALDCLQLAEEDDVPTLGLSRLAPAAVLAATTTSAPVASAALATTTPATPSATPAPAAPPTSLDEPLLMPPIPPLQIVDEPDAEEDAVTETAAAAATTAASPAAGTARGGMRYIWALPVVAMLVAIGVQWLPPMGDAEPQVQQAAAAPAAMPAASAQSAAASAPVSAQPATVPAAVSASSPAATVAATSSAGAAARPAANGDAGQANSAAQPTAASTAGQPAANGSAATASVSARSATGAATVTQAATAKAGGTPTLPLAPATHVEPTVTQPEPEPVADLPPPEKDDLVLPAEAIKLGSPKFLNGNWRAIVQQAAPLTGRPPQLKYQLRNGAGTARITQGDGVTCRADVAAAVMPSGNLVIKSRSSARCSDGTRYRMPELLCRQGLTGAAQCNGSYNDSNNTVLPMTMKRETR